MFHSSTPLGSASHRKRQQLRRRDKKIRLGSALLGLILALVPGTIRLGMGRAENVTPRVSGGPCEYKIYKGTAEIISIHKKEMPKDYGGPSHESYEVKFSYHTDEYIKEAHGKVEGKEHVLLLTNSWYPGPRFLHKYGIAVGKNFDCHLKVITKGPCTPVIFDFPAIDLSDYFESRK